MGLTCFACEKEILETDKKQMVGLDVPYTNLWFHKDCYLHISDLNLYLPENIKKVYNWVNNENKSNKNKKESR